MEAPVGKRHKAFVTVMEGCDMFCSFCIVPSTRGREISRVASEIEAEVAALASQGIREVTLLGQTVNAYGRHDVRRGKAAAAGTMPFADLLARLDAIEGQLSRLTAATEVNENALAALELRMSELAARGVASPATSPATGTATAQTSGPSGVIPVPGDDDEPTELAAQGSTQTQVAQGPAPERVEAVQAIAKPATGDQGDDEYVYGFRLWDAGFYPEAQQQLALFVEQYPNHWRTTYGRNLLGRAFRVGVRFKTN